MAKTNNNLAAPAAPKKKKRQKPPRSAKPEDFYAFLPKHEYWHLPTRTLWPAATINSILGTGATDILDATKPTHGMTWCPGLPMIVKDKVVLQSQWCEYPGLNTFNLYIPPKTIEGDPDKVKPWRTHGEKLWGDHLDHIEKWLAWRVQQPQVKINHALFLGSGAQGIGKDTHLHPVNRAVGEWNFANISAARAFSNGTEKNSFLQSTILRISEVHDLGDKRFAFYDATKDWMAAPPNTLQVSDKWIVQHPIFNVVGVIFTGNHKTDGLYLPGDDRRTYVAWSDATLEDFPGKKYFIDLWNWYADGGEENVAAYLAMLDISDFDPKAPPPKTQAWWDIVHANLSPESSGIADLLDQMGACDAFEPERPPAVTLETLKRFAVKSNIEVHNWLDERKNRRAIPHKLEYAGYVPHRNENDKRDGLFVVAGRRETIYVRSNLNVRDRYLAARKLIAAEERRKARAERKHGID